MTTDLIALSPPERYTAGTVQASVDLSRAPVVLLEISSLVVGDSPRMSGPSVAHAHLLAEADEPFPPIIVQRVGRRVIDGIHRLRAAELRGDTTIRVQFFDGNDEAAFLLAVRNNIAHGLPLTLLERRAAAERILAAHPEWSDRAIAATTGLSDKTAGSIRRKSTAEIPQSIARIGADGRVRPRDGDQRRRVAAELIANNPQLPLREIASAAGISPGTVRDVRARLRRGEDPVPTRQRAHGLRPSGNVLDATPRLNGASGRTGLDPQKRLETLGMLRNDPSLRFSASGRNALRWLFARMIDTEQWDHVVGAIPPHLLEVVADLARGCAESWQELAVACDSGAHCNA